MDDALSTQLDEIALWSEEHGNFLSPETLVQARTWITSWYQLVADTWQEPYITVDECQNLLFIWSNKDKRLTVYVDASQIEYETLLTVKTPCEACGQTKNDEESHTGDATESEAMLKEWVWLSM